MICGNSIEHSSFPQNIQSKLISGRNEKSTFHSCNKYTEKLHKLYAIMQFLEVNKRLSNYSMNN
jgi:hypothetical protein